MILHTTTGGYSAVEEDEDESPSLPRQFNLEQNYPNPFNPETIISYNLTRSGRVTLIIYNLLGQQIVTLVDGPKGVGPHQVVWNGKGRSGEPLASGVYFCRLTVEKNGIPSSEAKKMLLLK